MDGGGCSWLVGGGPRCRVLHWFLFVCSVVCSVVVFGFVECGAIVAFALGLAWSTGRAVMVRNVKSYSHTQLGYEDHEFLMGPSSWNSGVVFVVAVLQIWAASLMGGYSRWRVLVLDPAWSTWNSAVSHLILSSIPGALRWLLSLLPLFQFGVGRSVDFLVYVLVSKWVGCYQGEVLPESVVFVCCMCSSVLMLMLVQCNRVGCMRVTELDILCAFWMRVLGQLGLLLSVNGQSHCLMNRVCVVVCDTQS